DLVACGATVVTATSAPTITNAGDIISLANDNTISGVALNPTAGAGIVGSADGGTTVVSSTAITVGGTGGGISLANQTGSFTFSGSTAIGGNSSGTAVDITGGTA